jgi:hypothetical protein
MDERPSTSHRKAGTSSLSRSVEAAANTLGQGFVAHPESHALRSALACEELTAAAYFRQVIGLVYRLLFLFIAEERGLLHPRDADEAAKARYARRYGLACLREDPTREHTPQPRATTPWEDLQVVFRGLAIGDPALALPALGGLFAPSVCPALDAAKIDEGALRSAVSHLCGQGDAVQPSPRRWHDQAPEELGHVHEGLLELVPRLRWEGDRLLFTASRAATTGNARRATGSYYTPASLVETLLDAALEPVVRAAIAAHPTPPAAVEALLGLAVVDPAAGAGRFLLAAARRLAAHVARLEADGAPSPAQHRDALRRVITHCIHGVDLDPLALELCKLTLWLEMAEPGLSLALLDGHLQRGHALLGATPEQLAKGIPDAAWSPTEADDKATASALGRRNREARSGQRELGAASARGADLPEPRRQRLVADAWCAAFLWPKQRGPLAEAAPTNAVWWPLREHMGDPPELTIETTDALARRHGFFHWYLAFPQVFARGGFDVVLGNPPWVAHAGRAAQPVEPRLKSFYQASYESFADYPTTHGMFITLAARLLRMGGTMGLIVPSSVSDLGGYEPTRRAHDKRCAFPAELMDLGEGRFPGVTQPCMALVSRRTPGGRTDATPGSPWPVARPELGAVEQRLLARLAARPPLPPELFGERGVQSDRSLAEHFALSDDPIGPCTTPIREGTDVREFELLPARFHVDRAGLGGRIRTAEEFARVRVLIRQTARYPIAALSDGSAFRNSLLAGFESATWSPASLVALLNSALVRWHHYARFRDARQPILPQVKIAHLRAIPAPCRRSDELAARLATIGEQLSAERGASPTARAELDALVATLYELDPEERAAVERWHEALGPHAAKSTRRNGARTSQGEGFPR